MAETTSKESRQFHALTEEDEDSDTVMDADEWQDDSSEFIESISKKAINATIDTEKEKDTKAYLQDITTNSRHYG